MSDFQVSTIDGPAAGWHYNTLIEPDRVIWVIDFGDQGGWTRVTEGWPGAIAYTRAAYLPAGVELDVGVIAYVRAETLDSGCVSTHGGSGWATGSYRDGDVVACGACGARIPCANLPVPDWVENSTTRHRELDPRSSVAFTQWLAEANFEGARLEAAHRGREIHNAAAVAFASATGGSGKIPAVVLYDPNHKCPWWAGLPLIGRRHRCPVWAVDLEQ